MIRIAETFFKWVRSINKTIQGTYRMTTQLEQENYRKEREKGFWKYRMFRIQSRNNERGYITFDGWKLWNRVENTENNNNSNVNDNNVNDNNVNTNCESLTNYLEKKYIRKIVTINGKRYNYRETESGHFIFLYRGINHSRCCEIFFDKDNNGDKYAHLDFFYNFYSSVNPMGIMGIDMFLAIITLLTERGDLKYIIFSDYSGKELENEKWISLADMYFATTGKTWYGTIVPLIADDMDSYNLANSCVTTATWNDVYRFFKKSKPTLTIPVTNYDIDGSINGSAMQVYYRIRKENPDFFAEYHYLIMPSMGCSSMSGMKWKYYFPS